jgi:hypothetical protein
VTRRWETITAAAAFAIVALLICTGRVVAAGNELDLPAISAFAIGTELNIKSVEEMETDAFNDSLCVARERGEPWTGNAILIALRFARLWEVGSRQVVSAEASPSEWEPGRPLNWVRVTLQEGGWLDDSVAGQRYVLWLTPDTEGMLTLRRALWAQECHRPYWRYYSASPCP